MHLLLGVFKHGYGRYDAIRDDLTLCFHKKIEDMKSTMEIVEDGSDALGGTPVGQGSAGSLILRLGPGSDGLSEREREEKSETWSTQMAGTGTGTGRGISDKSNEGVAGVSAGVDVDSITSSRPASWVTVTGGVSTIKNAVDQSTNNGLLDYGDEDKEDKEGAGDKEDEKEDEKEEDANDDDEEEEGEGEGDGEEKLTLKFTLGKRIPLSSPSTAAAAGGGGTAAGDKYTIYTMPDPRTLNR